MDPSISVQLALEIVVRLQRPLTFRIFGWAVETVVVNLVWWHKWQRVSGELFDYDGGHGRGCGCGLTLALALRLCGSLKTPLLNEEV